MSQFAIGAIIAIAVLVSLGADAAWRRRNDL